MEHSQVMTVTPPLILEIEDVVPYTISHQVNSTPSLQLDISNTPEDIPEDIASKDRNGEGAKNSEESATELGVGPEVTFPGIDDHLPFWSTFDKVAGAYDRELMDGWNKSLDVLLIFAGLFSAINTAFIIESYRGLQADPVETTNALLRLLITHRNDNVTLSINELNPGTPSPSSVPVNSLFFSSLSFSLTAAFGAVTAKQWLTEYNNVGATKALHIQGRTRQRKFIGLKTWHLRLIIELLPVLLQASLLLFLVGVVHFLWTLDGQVATLQFVLSAAGVAVYIITVLIGFFAPDSPFQTPLSKFLPPYIVKTRRRIERIIPIPQFLTQYPVSSFLGSLKEATNGFVAVRYAQSFVRERFARIKQTIGSPEQDRASNPEPLIDGNVQWHPTDIVAAECVVWLLEQAEHPDITIIALDAVPRLPPDLLMKLIQEREGLLDRLTSFHSGLIPPSASPDVESWYRTWPNQVVVSGIALMHIAKARTLLPPSEVPYHLPSEISISTPTSSEQDPIQIAKSELANAAWFTVGYPERRHATWHLDYVLKDLSMKMGSFCAYDIELVDSRNVSIGNSYSPSVSPFRLVLDQIIQFCCEIPLDGGLTFDDYSHTFFDTLRRPLLALQDQISREALTYISLMLAAVCRCLKRRSTSTPAEEQRLKSLILKGFYNIHKGEAVADDVILAFSFIPIRDDIDQVGFDVFRVLFLASWWMLAVEYRQNKITEPNFPKALLRLAREHRHDFQLSFNIAHLVERCVDGDWASPLQDSEYADDIIHLLKCSLSPKTGLQRLPPTTELLDMISRMSDRDHFLQVIDLLFGSHNIHKLLSWKHMEADYRFWRGDLEFVRRVMQLPKHDGIGASVLLESQIWLAVGILPYPTIPWSSQSNLAVEFLNRLLQEEEDLHWPGYLISAGILPPTHNNALAGSRTLKFIEVETLKSYWELDPVDIFTPLPINGPIRAIWFGEAVLMLWKTAKLEIARETLPQNWNNGVFFENWMPGAMMRYYRSVCNKGYSGVDWQILREYFNAYLAESSQPRQQMESGSPVAGSEGVPDINPSLSDDAMELAETRRQITEVLAELDGLVSKGSIASANPAEDEK